MSKGKQLQLGAGLSAEEESGATHWPGWTPPRPPAVQMVQGELLGAP